jgi:hypothetical protein
MIEVSLLDLRSFIERQPDDKRVSVMEVGVFSPVGSVPVHYAKERGWKFNFMAHRSWVRFVRGGKPVTIAVMKNDKSWFDLFKPGSDLTGGTYGHLKQALR